ncbi:nucleotidyltransferase family protein [Qipengyuania oceanensis]|uniref:NTP transferase domain-containing protein n=1 Tax=Qipengyuania oceanensis TaxID=1463597 RepID=A0A844YCU9_9SPHN|nr:nucleotidyltransferase family protein [Qipengyuania oceanensis]MXO61807.1 NTP transferase domain-containing protein [Qipengyuania oceanensis]
MSQYPTLPAFDALVLAGSRAEVDPMALIDGYRHKSLIEVSGQSMLERVVTALRQAGAKRVLVSCNHPDVVARALELGAEIVQPAGGPSASVLNALDKTDRPLIVTTADHALLQSDWVVSLMEETPRSADFSLMFARSETIEKAVPGSKRTYYKFADGSWSGCNLFYLRTPAARAVFELWRSAERDRKKPWKLVARLGWRNLFDYLSGKLTAAQAIARVGDRIGVRASVVCAQDGLAAVDVDKPEDLEAVRLMLAPQAPQVALG